MQSPSSFKIICTIWCKSYCLGNKFGFYVFRFKDNEMGGACSTHERDEKCIENFGRETWSEVITWETKT